MNPADPESHHTYSHLLLAMGRYDESLVQSRRAIDLDPLNAGMRSHLALHFDFAVIFRRRLTRRKRRSKSIPPTRGQ